MATSAIDICEKALRKCHEYATLPATALTAPDTSKKAQVVCAEFYDLARRAVYRMAPWTCLAKRVRLAHQATERSTAYEEDEYIVEKGTGEPGVFKCSTAGTTSVTEPTWPGSWASGAAVADGALIFADGRMYECTTAGTSSTTEPTWPTSGTVTDGTVTWTLATTITDGTAVWTFQYVALEDLLEEHFTGYDYQYALPADYVNQVEFYDTTGETVDGLIEGRHAFAISDVLVLRYIPDEEDVTRWDSLLDVTMVAQLAAMIAYPLTGSHENEQKFSQEALIIADTAESKSRRERKQGAPAGEEWIPGLFDNRRRQT